jgi:hypothetical protein
VEADVNAAVLEALKRQQKEKRMFGSSNPGEALIQELKVIL